jgi:hypothetical protein
MLLLLAIRLVALKSKSALIRASPFLKRFRFTLERAKEMLDQDQSSVPPRG